MKKIKVRVYGSWTLYTYMKLNKETSCNCFKWVGRGLRGRDGGGNVNNVHYKPNQNCHHESPLSNKYRLIKKKKISF
jgi:hypothetical protein